MVDVAKAAGVSIATVSAAINGSAPVSSELKGRIEKAIRQVGYKANPFARSLKTGTTSTIGLMVADIAEVVRSSRPSSTPSRTWRIARTTA